MNVSVNKLEKKYFSIEDVVSYSNIEITNVNDNKPPARVIAMKIGIAAILMIMILALFLL
ncbi:MAG: hypothetical protein LBG04_00300 [Holosporaceae bacterium]|jgi:hypothetical protein|nr:hypothetical protein [Holosporaceae bacterium]